MDASAGWNPAAPIAIRPMGVTEVVDTGIRLARNHYPALLAVAAWGFVPIYVIVALLGVATPPGLSGTRIFFALTAGLGSLISGLGSFLVYTALVAACAQLVETAPAPGSGAPSAGPMYRLAWARFGSLLVMGIVLLFASLSFVIPPVGIFLMVRWSVAGIALVVESLGPLASLGRSWDLTRGAWWHTLGVVVVAAVLASVLGAAIGVVGGVAGAVLTMTGDAGAGRIVSALVNLIVSSLTTPLTTAILVVLYFELRARREGYDLRLAKPPAVP
jgi:hypothetical protein